MADIAITFTKYEITNDGVAMLFTVVNPLPGQPESYTITATRAELVTITTMPELKAFMKAKLKAKIASDLAAQKLDGAVGQTIVL